MYGCKYIVKGCKCKIHLDAIKQLKMLTLNHTFKPFFLIEIPNLDTLDLKIAYL